MMALGIVLVSVFVLTVGAVIGAYVALVRLPRALEERRMAQRLQEFSSSSMGGVDRASAVSDLVKSRIRGPMPAVDRMVGGTAQGSELSVWLEQSGLRMSVSGLVLISLGSGLLLFGIVALLAHQIWLRLAAAAIGIMIPFIVVRIKRTARLRSFEEKFPEALDLIARAVRAGHAFTTGMKMAADEVEDPVGPEFRKTFDEQNFGLPLKDALTNLTERVPSLDVRFFSTAVLIQRETGGNLAEILENLADVVRERFKILRQVRVYTAHGRLTGYVLLALPAVLAVALSFINPDHMNMLFRERMGQYLLAAAMTMQVIGFLWIRKVVKIEV